MALNEEKLCLLEDGKEAFPEILRQISAAKHKILVHMFIWREDKVGTEIAQALLEAADRGVSIIIEKDRYGLLLEYAEESQRSLFHSPDLKDYFTISFLELMYNRELFLNKPYTKQSELCQRLKKHPNIEIHDDKKNRDHSKYYIFDDQIIILGGINIEDKELYIDLRGRIYRDYMVKVEDPEMVQSFLTKISDPYNNCEQLKVNRNDVGIFEIKDSFLKLINQSEKELSIMMAYFAPDKDIVEASKAALDRGVKVRILISRKANNVDDVNKLTAKKLLTYAEANKADLKVYMTDRMLHAKLLMNEKTIIIGSCNITPRAFHHLSEMDICVENDDGLFARRVRSCVDDNFNNAECVSIKDLKFHPIKAYMEAKFS